MNETDKMTVSGTTRDVYLFILTSRKPIGVRDIWRGLRLSSPSLAQYHINKLLELKLIEVDKFGDIRANSQAKLNALRSFILLRGKLVPRLVVYGIFLIGLLASYALIWPLRGDFRDVIVVITSLFGVLVLFYEAHNQDKGLK